MEHITCKMIDKELRFAGMALKTLRLTYTEKMLRRSNQILDRFMAGRHTRGLRVEETYISRADGSLLRLCVYMPKEAKVNIPGLLWIHGGGFAIGIPEQDEVYITRFVEASGCVVVSPDYRRSLTSPYPAALEDCYDALLWMKMQADDYGIRSDQLFVGGDSAGGGLTAAVTLYARDKGEVAVAFQMPLYPMLDDRMATESALHNDAPVWNSKSNALAWRLYLGELFGTDRVPAYAAPARAADFSRLPPTVTFVGDLEPFRDETLEYVRRLKESGIPVDFKLFKGCFHAFDQFGKNAKVVKEARAFLMDAFLYAVGHYFAVQPKRTADFKNKGGHRDDSDIRPVLHHL